MWHNNRQSVATLGNTRTQSTVSSTPNVDQRVSRKAGVARRSGEWWQSSFHTGRAPVSRVLEQDFGREVGSTVTVC